MKNDISFNNEKNYLAARSIAESMLKNGVITPQELSVIDTILLEKYQTSLSMLLCGKALKYS